jgi:hypothetical protein
MHAATHPSVHQPPAGGPTGRDRAAALTTPTPTPTPFLPAQLPD